MDESGEKTEQATPQKLRDAQRKGVSLRSSELSMLATLVVAGLLLLFVVPAVTERLAANTWAWVLAAGTRQGTVAGLASLAGPGINLLAVQFVLVLLFALIAAAAYGGVHFSGHPLKPDFSRLDPAKGLKRVFSLHTLAETAKTAMKIAGLLLVTLLLAVGALASLTSVQVTGLPGAGALLLTLTLKVLGWLLVLQLLFAAWDLWYARRRYLTQLRMSRHEVHEEHKRQEGDPEIRRKRRQIQSSLLSQLRALGNVRNADVIITNPTHVAVALQYLPQQMDAPRLVAGGRGGMAAMIRTLARRHGVPLYRQPPLARALLDAHRIGDPVARELQPPVVLVYRWLLAQPALRKPAGLSKP